jgi:hypothetical protein
MANRASDKIPLGLKLDALTAQKVFGWKNVHSTTGRLWVAACKASRVEIKCGVADADSLGFDLRLVCF